VDDGGLMLIAVPAQPDDLKPFLVHGAIVDGREERSFISIIRRNRQDLLIGERCTSGPDTWSKQDRG